MNITFQKLVKKKSDICILFFEEGKVQQEKIKEISGIQKTINFEGKCKESIRLIHPTLPQEVYVIGLGLPECVNNLWREIKSVIYKNKSFFKGDICLIGENLSDRQVFQISLGVTLAHKKLISYKVDNGNNGHNNVNYFFQVNSENAVQQGEKAVQLAETQENVMTWIDTPSNIKTPAYMVEKAKSSAKKYGYSFNVMDKPNLQKQGMHALLAVGQGSVHPPAMVVLEYKAKEKKSEKIGFVGKGITFDTGGLSIKPSANMGYMKSDMSGAAALIGCIEMAAKLKLPLHIVVVLPLAENSVDATSIRPGDVISSYSGKSIEVIDTDAEGRLVLADGLAYMVKKHKPDILIDMATLTGSIVQSLGPFASGLFCNNESLASQLIEAGFLSDEKLWQLPLWEEYKNEMLSDIADIKNLSGKPVAGSITAAKFLEYFIDNHKAWAHIDIAGVAYTDSEYAKMRTATAYGVHLLLEFLEKRIKNTKK